MTPTHHAHMHHDVGQQQQHHVQQLRQDLEWVEEVGVGGVLRVVEGHHPEDGGHLQHQHLHLEPVHLQKWRWGGGAMVRWTGECGMHLPSKQPNNNSPPLYTGPSKLPGCLPFSANASSPATPLSPYPGVRVARSVPQRGPHALQAAAALQQLGVLLRLAPGLPPLPAQHVGRANGGQGVQDAHNT